MTKYRDALEESVSDDKEHPLKVAGLKMQAHHLISHKGLEDTGLGEKIKKKGYDINTVKNLVFLPSTHQGACHLGVQLHRGNHPNSGSDKNHPDGYHIQVKKLVNKKSKKINSCTTGDIKQEVCNMMNKISFEILKRIAAFESTYQLTKIYKSFHPENNDGCKNTSTADKHRSSMSYCELNRDHQQVFKKYPKKTYILQVSK